jgi:hypothetical protein
VVREHVLTRLVQVIAAGDVAAEGPAAERVVIPVAVADPAGPAPGISVRAAASAASQAASHLRLRSVLPALASLAGTYRPMTRSAPAGAGRMTAAARDGRYPTRSPNPPSGAAGTALTIIVPYSPGPGCG